MAAVVQLDRKQQTASAQSPLTPELREFIDRVIVPILVKQYLAAESSEKGTADLTRTGKYANGV